MRTAIGQRLTSSPGAVAAASAVGVFAVVADLVLVCWAGYAECLAGRGALAVLVLAAQVQLVGGDLDSVGLRLTPAQCWRYWVRVSLLIGTAVVVCIAVGLGAWAFSGRELPVYATSPANLGPALVTMCLHAPVVEEALYRLGPCVPLAVWLGPWRAIVVSGVAFAGLHVVGGTPSPENLVGGLFLAWAYLKSESIVVPVLLHCLGNLCALAAQVGAWYWFQNAV